ncbi:MAG TPA: diacylglycerol kinase family protein [Polyangia bacterium]|nr:diacylglycerol kinase family protein [Polyangia bacterium]
MIAIFVNPRSRSNRRDPGLAARLAAAVGDVGRLLAPRTLEELDAAARELAASPPSVIAIHGGDGTLHKALTALLSAFGERPLPPLAILGGGTMNVVTSSLHIREDAITFLTGLAEAARAGRPVATLTRRCMRVGDRYGFVFGNGVLANFLVEYYGGPNGYGTMRALYLLARLFLSALIVGPFMRRVFRRFRGRVSVDGQTLEFPELMAVGVGTVREVGLGFKLYHRADDDPDRFGVVAIHSGALALVADLAAVRTGRGISPRRAFSAVASAVDIQSLDPDMPYTIDGDLYRTSEVLPLRIGPALAIVDPRRL